MAGDQLDRLPADAAPADRARLVTALAQGLSVIDTDDDAAARSAEAVSLPADGPPRQRASALALHARLLGQRAGFSPRPGRRGSRLWRWPTGTRCPGSRPTS
ncbi:MAG: hypothetical protein R2734_13665 [Nocardioides sp.]